MYPSSAINAAGVGARHPVSIYYLLLFSLFLTALYLICIYSNSIKITTIIINSFLFF